MTSGSSLCCDNLDSVSLMGSNRLWCVQMLGEAPGLVYWVVTAAGVMRWATRPLTAQGLVVSDTVAAEFSFCGSEGQRDTGDRAAGLSKC